MTDTPDYHEPCSTCGLDADYELTDADPSKGNLACVTCVNRFWPLARIRRLASSKARPEAGDA